MSLTPTIFSEYKTCSDLTGTFKCHFQNYIVGLPIFASMLCFALVITSFLPSLFFPAALYRRKKSQLRVYQVIIKIISVVNQYNFILGSSAGFLVKFTGNHFSSLLAQQTCEKEILCRKRWRL